MQVLKNSADMQQQAREWKQSGTRIAFVPTMGNLHEGHLALVRAAKKSADRCVVSIFVNPTQFGPGEDFATYPRTLEADLAKLGAEAVDCAFTPGVDDMYAGGVDRCTRVIVPGISDLLEGEHRPGFFTGVATVVNRLFNIVLPDISVFGEKDYQQCLVIRRMVHDLAMPVEILSLPTVREADGLAMSSRNAYLDAAQRQTAAKLNACLRDLVAAIKDSADTGFAVIHACQALEASGFEVDYVVVRRQGDLQVPAADDIELVALAAVRLGSTRLIDNMPFRLEIT